MRGLRLGSLGLSSGEGSGLSGIDDVHVAVDFDADGLLYTWDAQALLAGTLVSMDKISSVGDLDFNAANGQVSTDDPFGSEEERRIVLHAIDDLDNEVWQEIIITSAYGEPVLTAPAAVSDLAAVPGNSGELVLTWNAPGNGGSAITDYIVEYKLDTEPTTWTTFPDGTSASTGATITGLTNGLDYDVRVSAVNAIGTGPASNIATEAPESGQTLLDAHLESINPTGTTTYEGWDFSDIATLFKDSNGIDPITAAGDTIGLVLNKGPWVGMTLAELLPTLSELKSSGAIGLAGSATAATYNTTTGVGTVSRAAAISDQSYVQWTGLSNTTAYRLEIQNTDGTDSLNIRPQSNSSTSVLTVAAGTTKTIFLVPIAGIIAITATSNGTTTSFTVISFKQIPGTVIYQPTAANRPLWNTLANGKMAAIFDGSNDCLYTPGNLTYTSANEVTVWAGLAKTETGTGNGTCFELSANAGSNNGAFGLFANYQPAGRSRGTADSGTTTGITASTTIRRDTLRFEADISADFVRIYRNGSETIAGQQTADQGSGNYGAYQLYIGGRNGAGGYIGGITAMILMGRLATSGEKATGWTALSDVTGA